MDAFLERAVVLETGWEFRRWADGRILSAENLVEACERLYGEGTYTVHRADLLAALLAAVPEGAIRLGMECTSVDVHADGVELSFADGRRVDADVVIGADGVHSMVRGAVTTPSPPEYSGLCAFRALVPADRAPAFARRRAQTLWIGPGHHLVHYPVSAEQAVNLVAFAPAGEFTEESWSATATVDELLAEFDGWDPRLTELIGPPPRRGAGRCWIAGRSHVGPAAASHCWATPRIRCSRSSPRARRRPWRTPRCWPPASRTTAATRAGRSSATRRCASRGRRGCRTPATVARRPITFRTAPSRSRATPRSRRRTRWSGADGSTGTTPRPARAR